MDNVYSTRERVSASRVDVNGVLKLTEAVNMLQDCSSFWLDSEPLLLEFMEANHLGLMITSRQIDILRLPAYGERVTVQTGVFDIKGLIGYRNTVILDEHSGPCVLTWSTGLLVHRQTYRIARFPQTAGMVIDKKTDMEYLDRKIICSPDEGISLPAMPVRRSDLDFYNHMNNAKYLEASLELLPPAFPFKRVRIEYKNAARPGDWLCPVLIDKGDKYYIILANKENRPWTITEFS